MSRRPQIHLPSYKSARSTISAILLTGLLVALCPATSWAADWYVDDDGDLVLGDGSAANGTNLTVGVGVAVNSATVNITADTNGADTNASIRSVRSCYGHATPGPGNR